MTTRLCLAAYQRSPYRSSRETAFQTRKSGRRGTDGSSSLREIKLVREQCATKVVAVGEKQVGASVFGECLLPGVRRSSAVQSVAGCAGEGWVRECEETERQVPIKDLRIGCIYKGKVSVVESYGVFVDIGAYTDGFVHISRLGRSFVRRVEDIVKVGQDVSVQIVDLDFHTNSISLLLGPEEGFNESVGLRTLTLSECEVVNRAAARRANKLAKRVENPLPRRGMSLETRQRLKAYRRAVLAERQAIQLHQARTRARNANDLQNFPSIDELDDVSKAKC